MECIYNANNCILSKKKYYKDELLNVIWRNRYSSSNSIGSCTELFRKLNPSDYDDFYNKYISYGEEHRSDLDVVDRGLSYDELILMCLRWRAEYERQGGEEIPLQDYFDYAVEHIIIETFDGKIQEKNFKDYLESKGFDCSYPSGYEDSMFGIDIKFSRNGRTGYLQIKPISFFKSKRMDVVLDRMNLCLKYEKAKKEYGIETYYAIYEKNKMNNSVKWIVDDDGNYSFKIDSLFKYEVDDDGCIINDTFVTMDIPKGKNSLL